LCTPALHAFNAYAHQPDFYGMKNPTPTFGRGLEPELKEQLYSDKAEDRLTAINTLVQRWIKRRITALRLTSAEQGKLQMELKDKRKEGMRGLESGVADGTDPGLAAGYASGFECSICNAACGMNLRPLEPKPAPRRWRGPRNPSAADLRRIRASRKRHDANERKHSTFNAEHSIACRGFGSALRS
jgi:hypothetical protein